MRPCSILFQIDFDRVRSFSESLNDFQPFKVFESLLNVFMLYSTDSRVFEGDVEFSKANANDFQVLSNVF